MGSAYFCHHFFPRLGDREREWAYTCVMTRSLDFFSSGKCGICESACIIMLL